jgi:hypothetical protein
MKKINKQEQTEVYPTFTGRKFRFFRVNAGISRAQMGAYMQKSIETIRKIEVWYREESIKPAYVSIIYKAMDEKLFNSIMNLWEEQENGNY